MAETKKIRMKISRGVPGGGIIRAGAAVEISEFWANQFIADGTAEAVEETSSAEAAAKPKGKSNGGNKKSKS